MFTNHDVSEPPFIDSRTHFATQLRALANRSGFLAQLACGPMHACRGRRCERCKSVCCPSHEFRHRITIIEARGSRPTLPHVSICANSGSAAASFALLYFLWLQRKQTSMKTTEGNERKARSKSFTHLKNDYFKIRNVITAEKERSRESTTANGREEATATRKKCEDDERNGTV